MLVNSASVRRIVRAEQLLFLGVCHGGLNFSSLCHALIHDDAMMP